jgi:hypothetical protein
MLKRFAYSKRFEALRAIARLYLKERHASVPYAIYHRIVAELSAKMLTSLVRRVTYVPAH